MTSFVNAFVTFHDVSSGYSSIVTSTLIGTGVNNEAIDVDSDGEVVGADKIFVDVVDATGLEGSIDRTFDEENELSEEEDGLFVDPFPVGFPNSSDDELLVEEESL